MASGCTSLLTRVLGITFGGFLEGRREQLTFGPTEEEGIAMAPDGRSLITSVGGKESAVWIHDARGDRQISSEGYANLPGLGTGPISSVFSPDV